MAIKNNDLASKLVNTVSTLQEAVTELYNSAASGNYIAFQTIANDFEKLLSLLENTIIPLEKADKIFADIHKGLVENSAYSFKRIKRFAVTRSERLFSKLEFELLPILDELYLYLYYACYVKDNSQKIKEFNENEWKILRSNRYVNESEKSGNYKYDVSIFVGAYNHLEYTKLCLEAILKHTPQDINYELILRNHGSNDGTQEYFESIGCTKQFDLKVNGIGRAAPMRTIEGRYFCAISNDVVVGPHYLDNMLRCIESDPSIKWVVPTTPNIANLQTIPHDYTDLKEMEKFAQKNNVSDPFRWEQRVRLCNPIELVRSADMFSSGGLGTAPLNIREIGFGDDIFSLFVRRSGGKCILAKDAFCHHFGSVTLRHENNYMTEQHIMSNCQKIFDAYGINPWGKGFCFDPDLFQILPCNKQGEVFILGIDCGLGSDPLKIRESIKEQVHNLQVTIDNITTQYNELEDLKSVSDNAVYLALPDSLITSFPHIEYDYIIFEGKNSLIKKIKGLENLINHLKLEGFLAIQSKGLPANFVRECISQKGDWHIWQKKSK